MENTAPITGFDKRKAILWGGGLTVVALLGYIGYAIYKNVSLLSTTHVRVAGVKLNSTNPSAWILTFTLAIENKSTIAIQVTGYNFALYVNGQQMTTATSNAMQSIAPEKTSNITVDATFDPTAVLKNLTSVDFLKSVLASYKDTSLRFAGTVSAQHSGVSVKNIPVDYTTKVGDLF